MTLCDRLAASLDTVAIGHDRLLESILRDMKEPSNELWRKVRRQ